MEGKAIAMYVHYGSKQFDLSKFHPVKNREYFSKPEGGLWGSPINTEYGWKQWCDNSGFKECTEENSFKFKLKQTANLLTINSVNDLDGLPKIDVPFSAWVVLDFEKLLKDGIDAIELNMSSNDSYGTENLYFKLYGWDCSSILVMNPDILITEKCL